MKKRLRNNQLWWIAIDLCALVSAYFLAIQLRDSLIGHRLVDFGASIFGGIPGAVTDELLGHYGAKAPRILLTLAVPIVLSYGLCDLYFPQRRLWPSPLLWNLVRANTAVFLLLLVTLYFRRNIWHPRSFFALVFLLNVIVARIYRYLFHSLLAWVRLHCDIGVWRVLLVGRNNEARRIERRFFFNPQLGLRLVEHIQADLSGPDGISDEALRSSIDRLQVDMLIVTDARIPVDRIMQLLKITAERDIALKILTYSLGVLQAQAGVATDYVAGIPLVHFDPPSLNQKHSLPRRMLSWAMAAGILILTSPLLLLSALLIKLEDDGPVFFIQERIGINQLPFRMFKFRTMHIDAEARQAELEQLNESGSGLFKMRRDPRVTRIGALLRKFSIDELPQFLNVLKGDMRIVGPRPLPRRDFEHYYADWHYDRHAGAPGLTCLWQISGRSEVGFENMCILDLFYLRNQNWAMDLRIVLQTIWVVLFGRGAY